jgi:hypothetical protein
MNNLISTDEASSALQKAWLETALERDLDQFEILDACTKMVAMCCYQITDSKKEQNELLRAHLTLTAALLNDLTADAKKKAPPPRVTLCSDPAKAPMN